MRLMRRCAFVFNIIAFYIIVSYFLAKALSLMNFILEFFMYLQIAEIQHPELEHAENGQLK